MQKKSSITKKYATPVLLALTFFVFSKEITARTDIPPSSNPAYQFINDHEHLISPVADAITGSSICGPWCGVTGGILGAINEYALIQGYTNKRYISYILTGGSIGNFFSPILIGAGMGVGAYFGMVFNNHEELVVPTIATAIGWQAGGINGLKLSSVGVISDAALSNMNITAPPHFVTTFVIIPMLIYNKLGRGMAGLAIVTVIISNVFQLNDATASWEMLLTNKTTKNIKPELKQSIIDAQNNMLGTLTPELKKPVIILQKVMRLYDTKFMNKEAFNQDFEQYITSLFAAQILLCSLTLTETGLNQQLINSFEHLNVATNNPFVAHGIKFAGFLLYWLISQTATNTIEKYYIDRLSKKTQDKLQEEFFSNDYPLRLSNHGNFSVYLDNLHADIIRTANFGSFLLSNAISTGTMGAFSTGIIASHAPRFTVYVFGMHYLSQHIMQYLATQSTSYNDQLKLLYAELSDITKDIKINVRTIAERDGFDRSGEKARELTTALIDVQGKQNLWNMELQLYMKFYKTFSVIFHYYLIAQEIHAGRMQFDKRNLFIKSMLDQENMFSWANYHAVDIVQLEQSLDRLLALIKIMESPAANIDKIERITQNGNQLILHKLEIGINDRKLVTADSVAFSLGKIYAITGKTGCGKTSLLTKIRGIKGNGIYGKGIIYYPKINTQSPKIVMLSQQDYFPPDSTLEQILLYPDKVTDNSELSTKLRQEILELLKEMRFTNNLKLSSKENWQTRLSGGEKKKILILSAILKKPDILILDEIFNGLNPESVKLMQKIIKKYLPNTLVLAVDHHAADNNFDFYDQEIHFSNKKLVSRSIQHPSLPFNTEQEFDTETPLDSENPAPKTKQET